MNDDVDRRSELIFATIAQEAAGFYSLILTVASTFLGGTLVFIDRIAPDPVGWSLMVLAVGWLSLLLSVTLIAWVRWRNIESGRHAQDGIWDKVERQESVTRAMTKAAIGALVVGMLLVTVFGFVNLAAS